jgi:DNA-binding HxlR family transcriptional regulator
MPVDRMRYSAANCSIARTLDVIGEKWTLLILREAFYGLRRFEDLQRATGCARNLLSDRLSTLVAHGILSREPYREPGRRQRHEYRLTDKGRQLLPVLLALMNWGDRWMADVEGPPVEIRHRDCDALVQVTITCTAGHDVLSAADNYATPGPGARQAG